MKKQHSTMTQNNARGKLSIQQSFDMEVKMLLLGVRKDGAWLLSTFNLTYRAGWNQLRKAVHTAYDYFEEIEILVDDEKVNILSKDEILTIEEAGNMTVRGNSKVIHAPLMITFFNQLQTVNVAAACATDEFMEADYRKFNLLLGQFMDSMELAMYS